MKRAFVLFVLLTAWVRPAAAGDVAQFVNLGFSENGNYFMFAQYGFSNDKNETYSSIFVVDVRNNVFVPGGAYSLTTQNWLEPGDSANGTFFTLIENVAPMRKRFNVDYTKKGRLLYISSSLAEKAENQLPAVGESGELNFQDFQSGASYTVKLEETVTGTGANVSSSFKILASIASGSGAVRSYTIGHPNYVRKGVLKYTIEQIILSPSGKSLVFVVARHEYSPSGAPNVRYMVETAEIR
jgi:predicted secreted protein